MIRPIFPEGRRFPGHGRLLHRRHGTMSAGLPFLRRRLPWAALALSVGCSSSGGPRTDALAARILPSVETAAAAPARPERPPPDRAPAPPGPVVQARADEPAAKAGDGDSPKSETLPSPAEAGADSH